MRYLLFMYVLVLMFSCVNREPEPRVKTQEELRMEEEWEIFKAVVFHEYRWALDNRDTNKVFKQKQLVFISRFDSGKKFEIDSNVYQTLTDSFRGTYVDVLPSSRGQYRLKDSTNYFSYGLYDSVTGLRGSSFTIGKIIWLSPLTVKVRVSFWSGPESAAGLVLMFTKKNLKWVFVLEDPLWIALNRQAPPHEKRLPARRLKCRES
jgi:hypothetical protein